MGKKENNNKIYDKANAYKLSKEERNEIEKDPLKDLDDDKKQFAEKLYKRIISTENMPYVLLINDSFGMGKTHFITRFLFYLKNNSIKSMYISVKEQDYVNDPLTVILKELFNFLGEENKIYNLNKRTHRIFDKILKIFNNDNVKKTYDYIKDLEISINNFKIDDRFSIGPIISFISAVSDVKKIVKKEKNLDDLKEKLFKYIQHLDNEKLVLVLDDLDRCNIDYVKRFLEVIKHIFDINGLFVIITGNKKLLEKFGKIDDDTESKKENYLIKYINQTIDFVKPNYGLIVDEYNLEEKLKNIHQNKYKNKRNDINELKSEILFYCNKFHFSPRFVIQMLDDLVIRAKGIDFEIDLPYLLYKIIFSRKSRINQLDIHENDICSKHPLSDEMKEKKHKLLDFNFPNIEVSSYHLYSYTRYIKTELKNVVVDNDCAKTIEKINEILNKYNNDNEQIFYDHNYLGYIGVEFKNKLLEFYAKKCDEIKQFYEEWQIETDEEKLKELYDNIFL